MIYISSSCVKQKFISDSVHLLAENGFFNIELSGGTDYYDELEDDLISIKTENNINFLCHNYFPPPKKHFVLNLGSLDEEIFNNSLDHYKAAIDLSSKIGAKKFGLHAGFYLDISINEIGKHIEQKTINNKEAVLQRFCDGFNKLKEYSEKINVELYIENNVFSFFNSKRYSNKNPFMLTSSFDYFELKNKIDFKLLLDFGHLKVSASTLGLHFYNELKILSNETDYFHLSENDGKHDYNEAISDKSYLWKLLQGYKKKYLTLTLEIYDDIEKVKSIYNKLAEFTNE